MSEHATEVLDPMIRIRLLGTLVYFRERNTADDEAKSVGAIDIRSKRPSLGGLYPRWLPIMADDGVSVEDMALAASDLQKLGHAEVDRGMIALTDAGHQWFREHYPVAPSPSAVTDPSSSGVLP